MDENRLDRLEAKIDKIAEAVASVDRTLERNTTSLEFHVKRTDLAEQRIEQVAESLRPIEQHVAMVQGALKLLTMGLAVIGTLAGLFKFFVP